MAWICSVSVNSTHPRITTKKALPISFTYVAEMKCYRIDKYELCGVWLILTEHSHGSWNNITDVHKQGQVLDQLLRTDNSLAEQLRQAEMRLSLKEKEVWKTVGIFDLSG